MFESVRYAVWTNIGSLNDIVILAENDQYRGAFRIFCRFCTCFEPNLRQNDRGAELKEKLALTSRRADAGL
jgi:hypothetical protein